MRYQTPPKEPLHPPKLTPSPGSSTSRDGDSLARQQQDDGFGVLNRLWDASTQCFDTSCTQLNDFATLGISKMGFEKEEEGSDERSQMSTLDRRKERHQQRLEGLAPAPFHELSLPYMRQNRNISELTMKSSWANNHSLKKLPDNRRMAYYAIGRHHKKAGGNRRCYFTGKLILNTAFYAGCVQQGLKTLVVFCLPSALGLPDKDRLTNAPPPQAHPGFISVSSSKSRNSRFSKRSQISNLDDLSLSIDGDLDPNWGMDRDYLANVLPEVSSELLQQMSLLYPQEFATLPVQVRQAEHWKLYTRFCFFSGLPIASNELHYKLRDEVCQVVYEGDEILLSHEVMEAVNQDSADILWLPNTKTFSYIKKHYATQVAKLDNDTCFERANWERVAPEV